MAYNKKTWLARLGQGLNKFIFNGGSKVTLDSAPDTVTQAGTPLSADNMNDLEQRIADEFSNQTDAINAIIDGQTWHTKDITYVSGITKGSYNNIIVYSDKIAKIEFDFIPSQNFVAWDAIILQSLSNIKAGMHSGLVCVNDASPQLLYIDNNGKISAWASTIQAGKEYVGTIIVLRN